MRIVLLVAAFGLGASAAQARVIQGRADVTLAGDPVGCEAAKLIPRTAETERAILAEFGSLKPAARSVPSTVLNAKATRGPELGSREVGCFDWRGYGNLAGFRFGDVAPGDYFVTVLSRGKRRLDSDLRLGSDSSGIYLMQPVRVSAAGAELRFEHRRK